MTTLKLLSSFYNQLQKEYHPDKLKQTLNLNDFLLDYYFENSTEYFFSIEEKEAGVFDVHNFERRDSFHSGKRRELCDLQFQKTEKYQTLLKLVDSQIEESVEKAYDIVARASSNFFQFNIRFCKKNPTNFSLHEKKSATYRILCNQLKTTF